MFSTFAPMNIRDTNSDARPPVSIAGNTRGIVRSVAQVGIPRVPLRVPVVPQGLMKKQVSVYPKGELYQHPVHLYKKCPQVARLDFSVEASFESAIFLVVKFGVNNILRKTLRGVSKAFRDMVDNVPRLLDVDFSALTEPRLNYAAQTEIDMNRVEQLSAASVYYNLNFGLVARMLGVEVFGDHRNVEDICERARLVSSESDVEHIKRILSDGCPAEFDYEESVENKKIFLQRGNHPSVTIHADVVKETLNKEERNSHVIPFYYWVVWFSTFGHHVPQSMLVKLLRKARLIWDGTSKRSAAEVTMNDVTSIENEPEITFGYVFMSFMIWIYNLRIEFPDEEIVLAFMDITACFRWPRINPDMIGAFGFIIGPLYFAASAMVFGSVASASSWEPFRRTIEGLATLYFARKNLVIVHKHLLDAIQWAKPAAPDVTFVRAYSCDINRGIRDEDGNLKPTPHHLYVDDDLLADTIPRMRYSLAAGIEAIFDILGWPATWLRQCALSMEKWCGLCITYNVILLGFVFDTRLLTIGISDDYRAEVLKLFADHWPDNKRKFTVGEIERLIGKLGRIGQAFRPIYHLMPQLYASVAYALRDNKAYLASTSGAFRGMMKRAKSKARGVGAELKANMAEINYAIGEAAKKIHRADYEHRMPPSLIIELAAIKRLLMDYTIKLATPIGHIIPRKHHFSTACDACKRGGGGWSFELSFWWHHSFEEEVYRRGCFKNNKHGDMISINCLEFVCVIINFAAAIVSIAAGIACDDPHPVLLNFCDNLAACAWVNFKCKESIIGRRLSLLFAGLLLNSNLGIQTEWIATAENFIADKISRLKLAAKENSTEFSFDFASLLSSYPKQLQGCRRFVPGRKLLLLISDVLLKSVSPDPLTIKNWEPADLGSVIS